MADLTPRDQRTLELFDTQRPVIAQITASYAFHRARDQLIAHLSQPAQAAEPPTLYRMCSAHEGCSFTMQGGVASTGRVVCPLCTPSSDTLPQRKD